MATRKSQSTGKSTKSPRKAAKRRSKKATAKAKPAEKVTKPRKRRITRQADVKPGPKPKKKPKKAVRKRQKLKSHKDHCTICKHPDVKQINKRIMRCQKASVIALDFPGISAHSILRHMHATGLDTKRFVDVKAGFLEIASRALHDKAKPKVADGIQALKAVAQLPDGDGDIPSVEKQLKRQVDNLIAAVGGLANGISIPK